MGTRPTDNTARTKMRGRLRKWGMHEDLIKICMVEVVQRQEAKRNGTLPKDAPLCTRPEYLALKEEYEKARENPKKYVSPDDSKYRPNSRDPLLHGAARATGATAKAVRRGTSYVKLNYDKEN